jgi:DNA-binding LytR/AlgR family response regulator
MSLNSASCFEATHYFLDGVHLPLSRWKVDYELPDFLQAHKSHLVNLNHANGLKPDLFRVDGYNFTFRGCEAELAVGRNYLEDLCKALGWVIRNKIMMAANVT